LLDRERGGVGAALFEKSRDLGVCIGSQPRGLVGRVGERTFAKLRRRGFGGRELEPSREARLAERRDRLPA
jgi:hypothetical protein